ncbi:hypothetical protein C2G38_1337285 [Gigaspora rosea]|uniref:Uncharacterized protein n=1 Tax=Gigaspora rosea TaxID=44941 RepID=A0A397VCE7_9GLOM|nr:hypothetical protein C2G38_1337285 [Gigaspora rosea]
MESDDLLQVNVPAIETSTIKGKGNSVEPTQLGVKRMAHDETENASASNDDRASKIQKCILCVVSFRILIIIIIIIIILLHFLLRRYKHKKLFANLRDYFGYLFVKTVIFLGNLHIGGPNLKIFNYKGLIFDGPNV